MQNPLVAWDRMEIPNHQGNLGFKHIYSQSIVLMVRWASQLLIDTPSEWTHLFYANLEGLKWENPCFLHRHNYSLTDKMLFNKPKGLGHSNYTKGLLLTWASLKNILYYSLPRAWISSQWTIQHLLSTLPSLWKLPLQRQRQISVVFVHLDILIVVDLWDPVSLQWHSFTHCL